MVDMMKKENITKFNLLKNNVTNNIYDEDFHVKRGERYFQLVAVDSSPIDFELVEELSESSRGEGGFGSTGR